MWSNESNLIRNNVAHADWNFQLSLKIKKFLSGNFIFSWAYIMEYLSDLHEKWMVREVNICSFWGVWRDFDGLVGKGLRLSFFNSRLSVCSETLWQQNWSITFVSWWFSHIKFCTELAKTCRYHTKSLWCSLDWDMCPPTDFKNSKSQTHNPKFWHFQVIFMQQGNRNTKIGQNATKMKFLECLIDNANLTLR